MNRDLSNISPQSVRGFLLRLPLRLMPKNTVVRIRSGVNKGFRWVVGAGLHGCWLGTYELEKMRLLERLVKPGMIAFDIGANAGYYTLALSRLAGDSGRVWSFEPLPENVCNLMRHVEINELSNVRVVQTAVAERCGFYGFEISKNNSMGFLHPAGRLTVPIVTLDDFITNQATGVPDLIKIDVEGAEAHVLEGARNLLRRKRTTILLALHGDEQFAHCRDILIDVGYNLFFINGMPLADGQAGASEVFARPKEVQYLE